MSITFGQPQAASEGGHRFLKPASVDGHLLLILSVDEKRDIYDQFAKKEQETVAVTLVDLDGNSDVILARFSHKGIVSRLKVGDTNVLVRVGKVQTKQGFAAWTLLPHTPDDAPKAVAWIEANATKPTFSGAAEQETTPPWGADTEQGKGWF